MELFFVRAVLPNLPNLPGYGPADSYQNNYVASYHITTIAYNYKHCKRGKIRWAKLLQIQLNEVFTEKLSWCLLFKQMKFVAIYKNKYIH